jgi:hypothetical protein
MEELQEEPPKTIENMRLSLLAVEVYERLCIDCIVFYVWNVLCIVDCIVYC